MLPANIDALFVESDYVYSPSPVRQRELRLSAILHPPPMPRPLPPMELGLSPDSSTLASSTLSADTTISVGDGYITFTLAHDVDRECSICLDKLVMGDRIAALECMHIYHPGCIAAWFTRSNACPECRDVVV